MTPPHLAPFTEAGDLVFLSGQLAVGPDRQISGSDIAIQTELALDNVRAVLASANLTLADVVKSTVWLTQAADFAVFNEVYARVFGDLRPARSTTISGLAHPQALVEIEVIARRPA